MSNITPKPLRILLSAYACEPGKGSEPGVGWNWALALASRGHHVWVLTRKNNQVPIERELSSQTDPALSHLHFFYYDLPKWASWWKKGGRGVHLYYLLWQWGAYQLAKKRHTEEPFDRVHHVTFVSVRQPSFMGELGIPFVFGPVAGGERAPWRLRAGYSWKGWLLDAVRDVANALVKFDPLMWRTFSKSDHIYVTSPHTRELVPRRFWTKTQIKLGIALEAKESDELVQPPVVRPPRLLYLGRFLYWKGMHLGLAAFADFLKRYPDARLSMIGSGPDEFRWRQLAGRLGIDSRIDWTPWVNQSDLAAIYRNHDVLLFSSLHDSGGMVVLEAMQHGLPVVCLKLGGPGALVDETCGQAVDVTGLGEAEVIAKIANGLQKIYRSPEQLTRLRQGARTRAASSSWSAAVEQIYGSIESELQRP